MRARRKYGTHGAQVWSRRRLEGALGRRFELEEIGGPIFHLQLDRERANWGKGRADGAAHAEVRMSATDWARVLTGEWSIVAVVLAGRAPYPASAPLPDAAVDAQQTLLLVGAKQRDDLRNRQRRNHCRPLCRAGATAQLVGFSNGLRFHDIPADVATIAKEQALATIRSCLAGNHMDAMLSMAEGMSILGSGASATLFGRQERVPAPTAALYNAGTAQVIEWDDWVIISHSGGAVVPTAFAAGEHAGAPGQDIIPAIVVGDEVNAPTSRAMQRGAYVGNSMPNHQIETA